MAKAIWNGVTIAESDDIALVEGNAYFPAESVAWDHLRKSGETAPTFCHWKGFASYYDIVVDGTENKGAVWTYEEPYPEAEAIKNRVAFWNGVDVTGGPEGVGQVEKTPSLRGDKTGWEALCWLLRNAPANSLSAADVTENTDIPEDGIEAAWRVYDVRRYAGRYQWKLLGGGDSGEAVHLEKAG